MESVSLGVVISVTAGLLSFLSPCVLPLVPSYVTFVTGLSVEDVQRSRKTALIHALLFVAGFTLIFLALGATATAVGRLLLVNRRWISRIGGVLVVLLGLYLLGAFNMRFLARERRIHLSDKPLGGILTYTATQSELQRGLLLLGAYSLGLAIPFVIAAVAVERFITAFQRFRSKLVLVDRVAGVLLVIVGLMMIMDYMTVLTGYLQSLTPSALRSRL
jgi:cytochrome c-type biogenesis protein